MKLLITFIYLLLFTLAGAAQVGIGEPLPDISSALEVSSVTSGVLFPRMTTAQRNAVANPAKGLLVFNTSNNTIEYNMGTALMPDWVPIDGNKHQSGTHNVGTTTSGWQYYNVTFATAFASIPAITIVYREGTGINQTSSHTVSHIKVANASNTGFTICIYDTATNVDVFIDWKAVLKTQ